VHTLALVAGETFRVEHAAGVVRSGTHHPPSSHHVAT
jgi:hypothetical protein